MVKKFLFQQTRKVLISVWKNNASHFSTWFWQPEGHAEIWPGIWFQDSQIYIPWFYHTFKLASQNFSNFSATFQSVERDIAVRPEIQVPLKSISDHVYYVYYIWWKLTNWDLKLSFHYCILATLREFSYWWNK